MTAGPFILEIDDAGDGPSLHVLTPASVLVVLDEGDLESKLAAFSDPIANGVVRNSPRGRRWYVEKILPALRYYCDKYEVDQPDWLASSNHWEGMAEDEQEHLFGPGELRLREFMSANCADIQVQRDEPEGGEQRR